jgi:HAD superfamily hydrolase (TIGR01509 family)
LCRMSGKTDRLAASARVMQVVVFDFFGVICCEIAPFVLPKYMSKEDAVAYKATIVRDADVGAITQAEMFEKLSEIAHAPAAQLSDEFWAHVRVDPEMVALIEDLRTRRRVALLTNATTPFLRQIAKQHDLERLFEVILVSSEEGIAKPDLAFYRRMVERLKAPAAECLFIDDNPENLDAARLAGMQALLFQGAEKLKRDLDALLR